MTAEMTEVSPAEAHHTRWFQKPAVLLSLAGGAVFAFLLFRLGTRDLSYGTDAEVVPPAGVSWDWEYAWELAPQMLDGLTVTAMAAVFGFLLAVVVGLFLALGRRSSLPVLRWPTATFIEFIRSTPLLIQLYFLFYALPRIEFLGNIVFSSNQALIIGIGIHYGTYCSEAYRAGINSVPAGQWEAATALNLGSFTKWTKVVLPQAIPNVLPALGNFQVAAFKDAPLGFAINVTGVLFFAKTIAGTARVPVEAYLLVGVGFMLVSIPTAWLLRRLERRVSYERI